MISIINVSDVLMRLIGLLPPSDLRINHFYDALIEIIIPENLVFVDTKRILCGDGFPNCNRVFSSTPLMLDAGHLSVESVWFLEIIFKIPKNTWKYSPRDIACFL